MRDQDRTPVSDSAASRRRFLQSAAWMAGAIAAGPGSFVIRPAWGQPNPIKVGIATDLTGPIGFAGNANANLAKMVANDKIGRAHVLTPVTSASRMPSSA